jgi:hypothetical protein
VLGGRTLILLASLLLVLAAIVQPPFVRAARLQAEDVATTAVIAYGALRAINAAISVAKETEFSVPVVGAVGAKPGMALDPVDETVARVSDAVFVILALTATLTLAFSPIAKLGALLAAASLAALWLALHVPPLRPLAGAAERLAAFGLLFALVLPAAFAGGGWIGKLATDPQLAAARAELEEASGQGVGQGMGGVDAADAEDLPWWRFRSGAEAPPAQDDAEGWLGEYRERAETILQSSVTIIGVYVLRLLVFPAILLGGLLIVVRQAVAGLAAPDAPPFRRT